MGDVYRGFDPKLQRAVAIKVLRASDAVHDHVAHQARMLREARALASVSHPNVVEVFEVGAADRSVFIAMELIDGTTVRDWVSDESPSWREVVRMYLQAGEGLLAAHESGVLHRDFKPSNALVGRDGRVRVVDFGLAKPSGETGGFSVGSAPSQEASERSVAVVSGLDLTQTGALVGTPAYMAPECLRGGPGSEAADQFSFCVSVWESLFGCRPFVGDSPKAVRRAVEAGRWVRPVKTSVPKGLIELLERGIAPRPQDRWPSMRSLLDALRKQVRPRSPVRALLLIAGWVGWKVAAGAGLVLLFPTGDEGDPCQALVSASAEDWSEARQDGLRTAFVDHDRAEAWPGFAAAIDEHMAAIPSAYAQVCEAARADADGDVVPNTALACVRRRYVALTTLLDEVSPADDERLGSVAAAVHRLPVVASCDVDAQSDPLPAHLVAAIADVDARLGAVDVLRSTNRYDEAAGELTELAARAADLGYPPLVARVASYRADIELTRGDHAAAEGALDFAYRMAVAAQENRLAMTASARMAHLLGVELARTEEALQWARHSEAAAVRLGQEDPRGHLWRVLGNIHFNAGQRDQAATMFEHAAQAVREDTSSSAAQRIADLRQLGNVYLHLRQPDESRKHFAKALELAESAFGSQGHDVAALSFNLGLAIGDATQDPAQSLQHYARAAGIYGELWDEHPDLGDALYRWGSSLAALGRVAEAEGKMRDGVAMLARGIGDDHPYVLDCRAGLAEVLLGEGRFDDVLELSVAIHAAAQGALGESHPLATRAQRLSGLAQEGLGRVDEARTILRDALRVAEQAAQPDPPMVWELAASLAEFEARHGDSQRARERFAAVLVEVERTLGQDEPLWATYQLRGLVLLDDAGTGPADLARGRRAAAVLGSSIELPPHAAGLFALTRLEHAHGDATRARARATALAARLEQDPRERRLADEVTRWLAAVERRAG